MTLDERADLIYAMPTMAVIQQQLEMAVAQEREGCAAEADGFIGDSTARRIAAAIRARESRTE